MTLTSPFGYCQETPQETNTVKPSIGVYYYPWYADEGRWDRVMRLHLEPKQEPKLGLYKSNDPEVISEHISQSVRADIDFWAVSWWGPDDFKDTTFRNDILKHPEASKLKYAILYETTGRIRRGNYDNLLTDFEYLQKHYFNDPNYLTINGKPVVFMYLTRVYFRNQGGDALKKFRQKFPNVYLVGDDVFDEGYQAKWAKNFDAVTAYDVYGQSIGKLGGTQKAVDHLAKNYTEAKKQANSVNVAFMPTVAPGYNDTAVRKGHPGRGRYFTDKKDSKPGDIFKAMIKQAALPNLDSRCDNIFMVTSFNEWYEDSQIEATTGKQKPTNKDDSPTSLYYTGSQTYYDYGYLYLDILREVKNPNNEN